MKIKFVRVDDRLIHGQIVQAWLPVLKIQEIAVVSDEIQDDKTRKSLMRLSVPQNYQLKIFNRKDAVDYLKEDTDKSIMVLCNNTDEARSLAENGIEIKDINIGGMHYANGKTEIIKNIFTDEKDNKNLKFFVNKNTDIDTRIVPTEERKDIKKFLN